MALEVSGAKVSDNDSGISTTNNSKPIPSPKSPNGKKDGKSQFKSETSSNSSSGHEHRDSSEMEVDKNDCKKDSSEDGYGYVSGQANLKPKMSTEQQESNSTSSNDEEVRSHFLLIRSVIIVLNCGQDALKSGFFGLRFLTPFLHFWVQFCTKPPKKLKNGPK